MTQLNIQNANIASQKVAVVTGAAGGIGKAIVQKLAKEGHKVAALDFNADGLNKVVKELKEDGLTVYPFIADIGSSKDVETCLDQVEFTLGSIHYLVNAAGILRTGSVSSLSDEDWEMTMRVNTSGVFFVSRSVTRRMINKGIKGSIVTVASNAASTARIDMGAYAASKAAVVAFTKCLGLEIAQHGIRCNIVAPGSTATEMLTSLTGDNSNQASVSGSQESFRVGIPLKRVAQPSHVADAVMFLLSELAGHITMETLTVDGGATLGA